MGRPTDSAEPTNSLTVRDNRTGKVYNVPIVDNSIQATAFKAMKSSFAPGEREENETDKGLRVADKGFLNTAVIRSEITYIDGEAGVLRYRGYPIEQLALHSSHLETAYLLIYGSLPTKAQHEVFQTEVMHHGVTHADAEQFCRSFRYDAHPMSILTSAFAYLGSYYAEANPSLQGQNLFTRGDKDSLAIMDKQIYRLIGKATTLAAMAYRVRQGRDFVTPPTGLSYTGSFLYQMDHLGEENYTPNPVLEKALDVLFLLHADHELNASATTVLQTGSSLVDPYSAIAAGCASLYGPLHGGANEAVIRMLISIGKPENVPSFIEAVKKREKVLSGFGHRVYKTSDPRSFIVRQTADEVFKITGKDELLETAMALHEAAMKDEYFIKRKLAPNVDFWSGLIYRAMGFPLDFFPVLFAVPRVVGWLAHWRQMMLQEGGVKIWRPRQIFVGAGKRDYVPIDERVPVEGPRKTPSAIMHSGIMKRTMLASFKGKPVAKL
ncbi:peroxysomal citrate synthase [Crassisporium funariophilum]|nr:peroxysomal citrate synthase [Crassisporium funariophilum]